MLVDIKIELSNIARENNKFAKEIAELRNFIQEQKTELDSLKTSIKTSWFVAGKVASKGAAEGRKGLFFSRF